MPRYSRSRERFPIIIPVQINNEYITKIQKLQSVFGLGRYKRNETIRRCIDEAYDRYFLPDGSPRLTNNSGSETIGITQ